MPTEPRVPPVACCPHDGAPLIATFAFRRAEFYCLECGARLGWLDPTPKVETPELKAREVSLRAEWDEHVAPRLRVGHWWLDGCEKCLGGEPHDRHATDDERQAHQAALEWLRDRAGRGA